MERYQVILAYDGSQYKGFQRQANAHSVQTVVEGALRKVGWHGKSILAAGRTDTGAHATGQVIAFDLEWGHPLHRLQAALNAYLPSDVVARELHQVPASFHPRFDASWRRYIYRIYCQPVRQPLLEPYAWRVWPAVELSALNEAAGLLVGTHDFGAFGTPPQAGGNTIRVVLEASWIDQAPCFIFGIKALAFLYHMVRRAVFMQVSIAQGKLPLSSLSQALEDGAVSPAQGEKPEKFSERLVHGLAPACGLVLEEVSYPPEVLRMDEDNG